MSNPKPYILTHILSNEEAELFSKWIKKRKKNRLPSLFEGLKSSSSYETDKSLIFKKVYNDSYTIEKDYLLRNDLRKLSAEITNFILQEICKSDDSLAYFDFLIRKKAFQLFEKEIKKTIEDCKKKNNESQYPYQKLWMEYVVRYTPRKKASLNKYHNSFLKIIVKTDKNDGDNKAYFILLLAILERIRWQYFHTTFTDIDNIYNLTESKRNTLSAYYIEKAKSFQLFGIERIDQLRRCIKIIEQIDTDYNLQLSEATYLESQLGLEYYLLPSFKESQEYFEKAYKKYAALDNSQQIQLIYNYTSLLTASEQYNSVINLLNKHGGIFLQTPYENSISLFSIMAHIYIGDIKHLRDLLPNINDINSKDTEIYMRIIECIILYYEDNYEICLTNLENIYNTSRYNQDLDQAYIDFSKIFQRFIIAKLIFDKAERAKKLDKCKSLSDKFINAYKLGFGSNMLCSVWLNREIEKSLLD